MRHWQCFPCKPLNRRRFQRQTLGGDADRRREGLSEARERQVSPTHFDLGEESSFGIEPVEQRALNHSMKKQFPMHKVKQALIDGFSTERDLPTFKTNVQARATTRPVCCSWCRFADRSGLAPRRASCKTSAASPTGATRAGRGAAERRGVWFRRSSLGLGRHNTK